jgi:hypothetical protein
MGDPARQAVVQECISGTEQATPSARYRSLCSGNEVYLHVGLLCPLTEV